MRAAARALLPLAAFLALVALADVADWGEGPTRAAALALAGAALALLWWRPPDAAPSGARGWLALAAAAALARTAPALDRAVAPRGGAPNDIGWTTARAVDVLAAGGSPYAALVDPQRDLPRREPGLGWFMGYKYGPLVPRGYAPFLRALGMPRGLYAANAALLAAAAALVALLAARAGGATAALAAAAALLWPSFARFELFWQGVNDLLPTALLLGALVAATSGLPLPPPGGRRETRRALAAGVLLGLSLSAKPLPGALAVPFLALALPRAPLAAGVALGLLPYVPDLLATPRELVANLVLFNLARPGDSTGLASALPGWLAWAPSAAGLAGVAAAAVAFARSARAPRDLAAGVALAASLFLAGGKIIHRNYLLWWLPLAVAALGALAYRSGTARAPGSAR